MADLTRFHPSCWLPALCLLAACSGDGSDMGGDQTLSGVVSIDGSSTVFPISEAMAEEFLAVAPRVRVTVGVSGTGRGFNKFLAGEVDINDASRHISESEAAQAATLGPEYLELPVASYGLSNVAHPDNDLVAYLTTG